MPLPTKPDLTYSYTGFQQAQGNNQFPGTQLDNDLSVLEASNGAIIDFLAGAFRSDGKLQNRSVNLDALAQDVILGWGAPTAWVTARAYAVRDTVFQANRMYICLAAHTAGVFATDLAAGRWEELLDLTSTVVPDEAITAAKINTPGVPAIRTKLGATTVGDALFTAASAAAARTTVGATTVGDALFTAVDAAAARATLQVTDWLRYRNRIVNPAMQVSQERGTAHVDCATGGTYVIDQWLAQLSTTPGGTLRMVQGLGASPAGSVNRLRATVQVADTSIAAGELYIIQQPIEGLLISDARFGWPDAKQILLRFQCRSSIAGTFGVSLSNAALNRAWVGTINISAGEVNTDLLRTFVIPGDTTGTWLTDTGRGVTFSLTLAAGTTFHGTAGWQSANVLTTAAQSNFMGTGGATFELFDVGLYVDTLGAGVFPPFEVPAFDDALRQSQRYFALANGSAFFNATTGGQQGTSQVSLPVEMRATPVVNTITIVQQTNLSAASYDQITNRGTRYVITATGAGATAGSVVAAANARF